MPKLVPDWCPHGCPPPDGHRCDAKLILCGEAPGQREDEWGYPFAGRSWSKLEEWFTPLGIRRSHCYITNVYPYRPPFKNDIKTVPRDALAFWAARLPERLSMLADPTIIVPMGSTALQSLFSEPLAISDWRGSIMGWTDRNGREIKVIPTFHPAATFRQPILTKFCMADWARIKGDLAFKELRLPEFEVVSEPNADEFSDFLVDIAQSEVMAVDIETDKHTNELLCVGFAADEEKALVIPTSKRAFLTLGALETAQNYVRLLCANPVAKVLQNGQFDAYHLLANGLPLNNYVYDLMELDHALDPNDGGDMQSGEEAQGDVIRISMKSLAVLASLHTRHPYYKKGGRKSVEEFNWARLMNYCGTDCVATMGVFNALLPRLQERRLV
jgi:uracil-DNA glycosylase